MDSSRAQVLRAGAKYKKREGRQSGETESNSTQLGQYTVKLYEKKIERKKRSKRAKGNCVCRILLLLYLSFVLSL